MIYSFPEPGCIPGVPGTFAGVRVQVHEDGRLELHPLIPPAIVLAELAPTDDAVSPLSETDKKEVR